MSYEGATVNDHRPVTEAVHQRGGVIFAQLMHTGRVGHPSLFDEPRTPVGASPVRARGQVFTPAGPQDFVTPEELSHEGVLATIADFALAARNAVDAGFDGVELHGANGYLLHQFVSTNANLRDDAWGGSPEKRVRLTTRSVSRICTSSGPARRS